MNQNNQNVTSDNKEDPKVINCLSDPNNYTERSSDGVALDITMSLISELLGAVPVAGSYIQFVFDKLWSIFGPSDWDSLMEHVEALIDSKIQEHVKRSAQDELKAIKRNLSTYLEFLDAWENDSNNLRARAVVKDQFVGLEQTLERKMVSVFGSTGHEVHLLPIFAQAANLHLILLRDAEKYGKRWGWTDREIQVYYDNQVRYIHEYTDHCVKYYNQGLSKLKGSTYQDWDKYNRYRREMTLTVLDLISIFPSYDTRTYPIDTIGQLTREVYSDLLIANSSGIQPFTNTDFDNILIRKPHLMDFLRHLEIFTDRHNASRHNVYWGGHRVHFSRAGDNTYHISPLYGSEANVEPRTWLNFGESQVYLIYSKPEWDRGSTWVAGSYEFRGVTGSSFYRSPLTGTAALTYRQFGPEVTQIPLHRLCHVTYFRRSQAVGGNSRQTLTSGPLFSWTHSSATDKNNIDPTKITQIPMVKASSLGSGTSVVQGPGFTGGDILKRTSTGTFASLGVVVNSRSQQYRVRIRYASTADLEFVVKRGGSAVNVYGFQKTMNKGQALTYDKFKFATFSTPFRFSQGPDELAIAVQKFSSGNEVYVDRIEVIPVLKPDENIRPDIEYQIVTALNDASVVNLTSVENNIVLGKNNGGNHQKWKFIYDNRGAYQIQSVSNPELFLVWNDVPGDRNDKNVMGHKNEHKEEHYWILEDMGNGYYIISSKKKPSLVLDVDHANTNDGTNIKVNERHPIASPYIRAQQFKLKSV
ncbi:insecticidal delta-endotoxin Cry8Ea1 family protein [Paenibacillus thiaminolyticus]|uniref:insecticidal delta-endotoxin Cry8Ea1 family protein n=1 Tax=Paenibacillus thiaminolyticus TaxID=49283 RepID=UPI002543504D|nr:insecticidal delta-endotoxin Cry8Ea1 family protein [Paenibacillus thiaminolyticus]WII35287.1 insecticidal delta-endotoxin Cry8Ea1 family protein [Paenibacillus thiaminolyticus]